MAIMALDLGTKTGWATRVGRQVYSGTVNFSNGRFEGGGMRFLKFRRWLDEHIGQYGAEIWYEEVRGHKGTDAAHIYGGLLAMLTAWCEERNTPYAGVPVATLKKHIAGTGNAAKKDVIKAVKKLGFNAADDNEADAIALLLFVEAGLGKLI